MGYRLFVPSSYLVYVPEGIDIESSIEGCQRNPGRERIDGHPMDNPTLVHIAVVLFSRRRNKRQL